MMEYSAAGTKASLPDSSVSGTYARKLSVFGAM